MNKIFSNNKKEPLETYFSIKISRIKHLLSTDKPIDKVRLVDTYEGRFETIDLKLTTTPCQYGGFRYWFICDQCNKRVGIVYEAPNYICRYCLGLSYKSQLIQPHQRKAQQLIKIYKIMGWQGIENIESFGKKPKHMKYMTYIKKCEQINEIISELSVIHGQRAKKIKN